MRKHNRHWLALAAILVAIGLLYGFMPGKNEKPSKQQSPLFHLEKRGAGTIADYTAASKAMHIAVDTGLRNSRAVLRQLHEEDRSVSRKQVEGTICWHTRQILVEKAKDASLESMIDTIQSVLPAGHGKILATQADTYQGVKAERLDVGFEDTLDGELVTIISDRIYVRTEAEQAVSKKAPVTAKGELAIIIDDFGYASEPIAAFAAIKQPLTFSVLPYRPYSNEAAANALSSGHQVMLHLPMEPQSAAEEQEPTSVTTAMNDQQIQAVVKKAIQTVPGIVGVNNHQGSRATTDKRVMQSVLTVIKNNSLFFVDSRTTAASVAASVSRQMKVPAAENDLFIDNSSDITAIKNQLRTAVKLALRHGKIIAIGHARPNTATAIREMIPEFEAAGIRLVFVSKFVK